METEPYILRTLLCKISSTNERVSQGFTRSNPTGRIKRQALVKQINERGHQLHFFVTELKRARGHQACPQVSTRFRDVNFSDNILSGKKYTAENKNQKKLLGDGHYRLSYLSPHSQIHPFRQNKRHQTSPF